MDKKIIALYMTLVCVVTFSVPGAWCAEEAAAVVGEASAAREASAAAAPQEGVVTPAVPAAAPAPGGSVKPAEEVTVTDPGNVTVNFKGADIRTVLSYISEVAGVDIVPAPDVKGVVDLKLTNKPWKTALDIIVRNYGFAYERDGDIIRVVTLDRLRQEEPITQTFVLNYGKAKIVADSIRGIITDDKKLRYDERTNMIVVTDQPTKLYKVSQVIASLDKMTEQVLIETIAVETTLGDNERMGIDWTAKITATGAKRPTTFPFERYADNNSLGSKYVPLSQTGAVTTTYDVGGQLTSTPPGQTPTGISGPGTSAPNNQSFPYADITMDQFSDAFQFGTLDFTEFKAVLEFIKQRSDVDVVANPRIMTLDNEPATIHVGLNVFLPKFERNSTTGKMEITGYEYAETVTDPVTGKETTKGLKSGVNLRVVPHINEKGEIIVDLEPTISDEIRFQPIDPQGNIVAPVVNERTAKTQARINDGDTIFIGGLIHETDEVIDNTLPFIGDMTKNVPYLSYLFNHKSTKKVKKELIFFVTVNIMKPGKKIPHEPVRDLAPKTQFEATQQEKAKAVQPKKKKSWIQNLVTGA